MSNEPAFKKLRKQICKLEKRYPRRPVGMGYDDIHGYNAALKDVLALLAELER